MRRRLVTMVSTIALCLGLLLPAQAAEEGTVVFQASTPDEEGYFTVTMTMQDITFRVFQFALRYDPAVVTPVDTDGNPAGTFEEFAQLNRELSWISTVGTGLDSEAGLIDFTGYIMPGARGDILNEDSQAVIGGEGLQVYTFYFQMQQEGDMALQVATEEKGEPYNPACPQGVIVGNSDGLIPVTVTFDQPEGLGEGGSETHTGQAEETAPTAEELLKHSILLQVDSHAAVVDGGVTAIYPGEQTVTAYGHDGRVFIPVRFVTERLGATVDWENETQTVVIRKDGHVIRMTVGQTEYTVDGETKTLDVPAEYMASTDGNSRTMVPIRFVVEALGYQVEWDYPRQMVVVGRPGYPWDMESESAQTALIQADGLLKTYSSFV